MSVTIEQLKEAFHRGEQQSRAGKRAAKKAQTELPKPYTGAQPIPNVIVIKNEAGILHNASKAPTQTVKPEPEQKPTEKAQTAKEIHDEQRSQEKAARPRLLKARSMTDDERSKLAGKFNDKLQNIWAAKPEPEQTSTESFKTDDYRLLAKLQEAVEKYDQLGADICRCAVEIEALASGAYRPEICRQVRKIIHLVEGSIQ